MKYLIGIILIVSAELSFSLPGGNGLSYQFAGQNIDSALVAPHLVAAARELNKLFLIKNDSCLICEQVADSIISLRRSNATRDGMAQYLNQLCVLYTDWGAEACKGRVNIKIDIILYIIDNKKDLQPVRFCSIYFQQYSCEDPNADSWSIPLPDVPPKIDIKSAFTDASEPLEILQITDVHLDSLYTPGTNSKCSMPLCCESGIPANADDAAGYWGDYNVCDVPWHTIEDMVDMIQAKHKHLDWIYFTGDIVSHRSWASSKEGNSAELVLFFNLLSKTFPNITVFPILGNHDAHPSDHYSPTSVDKNSNISTQWLFDLMADEWTSRWLPNDTETTIKKGGYYTVLVKPGFRVIALNSNVCYSWNLWLVYENKDTYNQLQWLVDVLTEAERNGEKVHILSHIPSSDVYASCVKVWSKQFTKIVLRFSDTIVAQFNGHTHLDEIKLFFDSSTLDEVKAVAYNGASFVPYVGSNPNYRIYEVVNNNMTVTDYSEYTFNLTEANSNHSESSPQWYKLYSFKEAYGLPDLTMKSLEQFYWRLASNDSDNELVEKYFRYRYRDSDVYTEKGCDSKCKKQLVCLISAVETSVSIADC